MTTKTVGGKITGLLALTLEATAALNAGDPVHVSGDFQVARADGTKPCIGWVSVPNVRRGTGANAGLYPVANTPGDVTVEARGYAVKDFLCAAVVAAGVDVGFAAANPGQIVPFTGAANTVKLGVALHGGAIGARIDVLVQ